MAYQNVIGISPMLSLADRRTSTSLNYPLDYHDAYRFSLVDNLSGVAEYPADIQEVGVQFPR